MSYRTHKPDYTRFFTDGGGQTLQAICESFWAAEALIDTPNPTKKQARTFIDVVKTHLDSLVEYYEYPARLPEVCQAELAQVARNITEYYPTIVPANPLDAEILYAARAQRLQVVVPLVLSQL